MAWFRVKTVIHSTLGVFEGNFKVVENPKRQLEEDLAFGAARSRRDFYMQTENGAVWIPPAVHDYTIIEVVFEEIEPPAVKS